MVFDYRSEYSRYKRYYTYLEPMAKSPIIRAYFSLVLSFFAMAVFGIFAIRPTVKTIVSLKKEIEDKRKVNNALQEKINSLSIAQADFAIISSDLPMVFSAMPEDSEIALFIKRVEDLANRSGAELSSLQIQGIPLIEASETAKRVSSRESKKGIDALVETFLLPGERVKTPPISLKPRGIVFSLSLYGSYPSFLYFLENLSYLDRLVTVDRAMLSVERSEKTPVETLVLNLSATTYFLKETD